jgi:ribosomal protein S18 acetylase RimI-like enzyme
MANNEDISIRVALADDVETIHSLVMALAEDIRSSDQVKSTAESFRTHGFSESPSFESLLAERDGEPVGLCIYFYTFSSWRGEVGVYVQDLYVSNDVRGTGLGKKMLAETVRRASTKGATHLRLCVDHDNDPAQNFYRSMGMKWRDDDYVFEADGPAFTDIGEL